MSPGGMQTAKGTEYRSEHPLLAGYMRAGLGGSATGKPGSLPGHFIATQRSVGLHPRSLNGSRIEPIWMSCTAQTVSMDVSKPSCS